MEQTDPLSGSLYASIQPEKTSWHGDLYLCPEVWKVINLDGGDNVFQLHRLGKKGGGSLQQRAVKLTLQHWTPPSARLPSQGAVGQFHSSSLCKPSQGALEVEIPQETHT